MGETLSPLHIPFVTMILNSLLPILLRKIADGAVVLLPLQSTLSMWNHNSEVPVQVGR